MATTYIPFESPVWSGTPRTNQNQYVQDAIDAGTAGDTYILNAGTHRGQDITLDSEDVLELAVGAILSGAEDIGTSGWSDEGGGVWSKAVQSNERNATEAILCAGGYDCWNLEVLVIDGIMVAWADTSGGIDTTNAAYHDGTYAYIGVDPATVDTIEIARATYINGDAAEMRGASPAERAKVYGYASNDGATSGAIHITGTNPILRDLDIFSMAGLGVGCSDDNELYNVSIHHCGQLGVGAAGPSYYIPNIVIGEGCFLHNNAIGGWNNGWEGGNTKMADTESLTVKGSFWRMGDHPLAIALAPFWFDINNDGYQVYANVFDDSDQHVGGRGGIFLEISHSGQIHDNIMMECGWDAENDYWAGGLVLIDGSGADQTKDDNPFPYNYENPGIEIWGNLGYRCAGGLNGVMNRDVDWHSGWDEAGYGRYGYWMSGQWYFHHNTVYIDGNESGPGFGVTGISMDLDVPYEGRPKDGEFDWDYNIYFLPSVDNRWNDDTEGGEGADLTWAQWQAAGYDNNGERFLAADYDPYPFNGGAM